MSPLTDRDVNAQLSPDSNNREKFDKHGDGNDSNGAQQQNTLLNQIAKSNSKPGQAYVSPSDAILSPASKKLSDFKQKQIDKQGMKKPAARTLFARTTSSVSSGSDSFETPDKKP